MWLVAEETFETNCRTMALNKMRSARPLQRKAYVCFSDKIPLRINMKNEIKRFHIFRILSELCLICNKIRHRDPYIRR